MKDNMEQKRRTYEDTLAFQKDLRNLIKKKRGENTMLLPEEKKTFGDIFPRAFLSQGKNTKVYFDTATAKIFLGTVHSLCLKMMDWKNPIRIKNKGVAVLFQPKHLWSLLYNAMRDVFPKALDEAIHMSAEVERRKETEGYDFEPTTKL